MLSLKAEYIGPRDLRYRCSLTIITDGSDVRICMQIKMAESEEYNIYGSLLYSERSDTLMETIEHEDDSESDDSEVIA
jgi:hypothetical protein